MHEVKPLSFIYEINNALPGELCRDMIRRQRGVVDLGRRFHLLPHGIRDRGPEPRRARGEGRRDRGRHARDPHFVDARSSYELGKPELQVLVDRDRAADLGVPVRALADTVRALVGGLDVATFQDEGRRFDVRLRLEEAPA